MNHSSFSVPVKKLINEFELEVLYMPDGKEETLIYKTDVNRPGLNLTGFFDCFDNGRVQILGLMEFAYLKKLSSEDRFNRLSALFAYEIPCVIIARGQEAFPELFEAAKKYQIPVMRTDSSTSDFHSGIINYLNVQLAPRITRHGVLIEVYGEGVLLTGDGGVGKSEAAIELIKRGHRLVADDAVEIRRVSNTTLVGSSPENIRHFLELRGIGIINARRLFGMGAIKNTERIELIVKLEAWDPEKIYDRMGMENEYTTILGIKVPSHTVPVKPGRNLAIILEVAAMNNRQKKMGYNAAQELMQNLGMPVEPGMPASRWDLY
jgi:HPr kinase/phosphorylase